MLQLHEPIRVLHIVTYPTVFILFYDRCWREGVFKPIKNDHFLIFFLFPQVYGQVKWVILQLQK